MGMSTDATISYGVMLDEDYEFPWADFDDIDNWWASIRGYKPPFELFDADGNYLNGVEPSDGKVSEYFAHRREWETLNPLPVDLVNYCSGDYEMYILAVPGSTTTASRGYPKDVTDADLSMIPEGTETLRQFCEEFGFPSEFKWWLSSYWG